MKKLLLVSAILLPDIAHAQVSPAKWSQNYVPTLIDWRAALLFNGEPLSQIIPKKVDANNGSSTSQTLISPTINSAIIDSASTVYGPTQANLTSKLLATGIRLTPQMYGAKADGTTDDTAAVQSAVSAVCSFAKPGGEIFFPAGTYRISSVTVTCGGVYFVGAGVGNRDTSNGTIIDAISTTAPVINFHAGSQNYTYGGGIRDISFKDDSLTLQPMLEADFVQQFSAENLYVFGAYAGIKLNGGIGAHLAHIKMEAMLPGGTAIELYGLGTTAAASSATRMDTPVLSDIALSAGAGSGPTGSVHMNGIVIHGLVATPQLIHVEILNPQYGVWIHCDGDATSATELGACPQFPDLRDVEVDFAHYYGIYAEDFQHIKCIGCYVHGASGMTNAIKFANHKFMSYGAQLIGGKADSSGGSLVYSTVQGTHVSGMDLASANNVGPGGAGVELNIDALSSTIAHSVVSNNTMCLFAGSAPTAMAGINVQTNLTNVVINGNLFSGCTTGVAYNGSSDKVVQTGNVGP